MPIEAVHTLTTEHGINVEQIDLIVVRGSQKMVALHNIPVPADLIMAQYSVPWCVAAALVGDALNPLSFGQKAFDDPRIAALSARISVENGAPAGLSSWGAEVNLRLRDGTNFVLACDNFPGTPERPLTDDELKNKFLLLAPKFRMLFSRLMELDTEQDLNWLAHQKF